MAVRALLSEIEKAESDHHWREVFALRIAYHREYPDKIDNIKRIIAVADRLDRLSEVIWIARHVDHTEYRDLLFSLPLIRFATKSGDLSWADDILAVIKRSHDGNEWPVIAESELLNKKGKTQEALSYLARRLPSLQETYAFMNVSDTYYRILNEPFSSRVDPTPRDQTDKCPLPDALFITLIKDEDDIIYANLRHHYRIGFRNYALINNESKDSSLAEVHRFRRDFSDAIVFIVDDPIVAYVQDSKITAAMHFAAAILKAIDRPVKWVFAIDADEFICFSSEGMDLSSLLRATEIAGKRVLTLAQINASTPETLAFLPVGSNVLPLFTCRMAFPLLPVFKVGAIYSPTLFFDVGNHRPNRDYCGLEQTASGTEFGAYLLHMPLRSIKHATTKLLNGVAALNAAPQLSGIGTHWRNWYAQYEIKGPGFFEELLNEFVRNIVEQDAIRRSFPKP